MRRRRDVFATELVQQLRAEVAEMRQEIADERRLRYETEKAVRGLNGRLTKLDKELRRNGWTKIKRTKRGASRGPQGRRLSG